MKNVIDLIKKFFESADWAYDFFEEKNIFTASINLNNIVGVLRIYIFVGDSDYLVYTVLNSTVEKSAYAKITEYIHRVNYGLDNGNFEFDYNDGEIRYKTFVNFKDSSLSDSVIEDSIFFPAFMFDQHGKNLFRLMLGEGDPEQLINEGEHPPLVQSEE